MRQMLYIDTNIVHWRESIIQPPEDVECLCETQYNTYELCEYKCGLWWPKDSDTYALKRDFIKRWCPLQAVVYAIERCTGAHECEISMNGQDE